MRAEVRTMTLAAPAPVLDAVRRVEADLRACGRITQLAYTEADVVEVREAELIPVEKKQHN
jgi:valyl-tRNA synthetase